MLPFDDVIMITSVAKWTPRQVQRKVSVHFTLQESPTYFRTCSKKILPLCNYIDNIGAHLGQCFPCQKVLFVNAITGDKHVLCEHVLYIDMCTLDARCTVWSERNNTNHADEHTLLNLSDSMVGQTHVRPPSYKNISRRFNSTQLNRKCSFVIYINILTMALGVWNHDGFIWPNSYITDVIKILALFQGTKQVSWCAMLL